MHGLLALGIEKIDLEKVPAKMYYVAIERKYVGKGKQIDILLW